MVTSLNVAAWQPIRFSEMVRMPSAVQFVGLANLSFRRNKSLQLTAMVCCLLCPYCKEKIYPDNIVDVMSLLLALSAAL